MVTLFRKLTYYAESSIQLFPRTCWPDFARNIEIQVDSLAYTAGFQTFKGLTICSYYLVAFSLSGRIFKGIPCLLDKTFTPQEDTSAVPSSNPVSTHLELGVRIRT